MFITPTPIRTRQEGERGDGALLVGWSGKAPGDDEVDLKSTWATGRTRFTVTGLQCSTHRGGPHPSCWGSRGL